MLSMLICDQNQEERDLLKKHSKDSVAFCSNDELEIGMTASVDEAKQYIEKQELLDVAFQEVTMPQGITMTKNLRIRYQYSELLLIADASISPMAYLTPEIRAASLLLRPFSEAQSRQVVNQFFQSLYRERTKEEMEKVMIIENRQGKIRIPYDKIYYIEVKGRKIYIRLKDEEYSKYETMEQMIKKLPKQFLRCHRSFVINKNYVTKVRLSENLIYLEDEITVPLSRRYKADMKAYMNCSNISEGGRDQ